MPTCQPTCGLGWLLGRALEMAGNSEVDAHVAALTALIG
jgi:hypothetical protein